MKFTILHYHWRYNNWYWRIYYTKHPTVLLIWVRNQIEKEKILRIEEQLNNAQHIDDFIIYAKLSGFVVFEQEQQPNFEFKKSLFIS